MRNSLRVLPRRIEPPVPGEVRLVEVGEQRTGHLRADIVVPEEPAALGVASLELFGSVLRGGTVEAVLDAGIAQTGAHELSEAVPAINRSGAGSVDL